MRLFTILLAALASSAVWGQNLVVVSGQVTDGSTGLPIEDATVSIGDQLKYTDSGGRFTLDPIAPESAEVRVEAKGYLALEKTKMRIAADQAIHDFRLLRTATISGRISAADSEWRHAGFLAKLLREDFTDGVRRFIPGTEHSTSVINEDGYFEFSGLAPGRYIVDAGPQTGEALFFERGKDGKPVLAKHVEEGYVSTFFPGTPDFDAAIPITIGSGESQTADFSLLRRPFYRVSGEIEGGIAKGDEIQVESEANGRVYTGAISDGKFVVEGLPAGQYRVSRMVIPGESDPIRKFQVSMSIVRLDTPFPITDHDVTGLHVIPLPPAVGRISTTGKFLTAGSSAVLPEGLSVRFSYPNPGGQSTPIAAAPDGTFWLNDLAGEYSVRPVVSPAYAVTEIRYAGGNYPFSLIPLGSGTTDASITIVLSDQPASVSGMLIDYAGKPVAGKIALLPDPIPPQFDFRAIRVAVTNDRGEFALGGLAPGRYKAVALTGDDRRQDHDMSLIGPRLGTANAFELAAGQNLRIEPRP